MSASTPSTPSSSTRVSMDPLNGNTTTSIVAQTTGNLSGGRLVTNLQSALGVNNLKMYPMLVVKSLGIEIFRAACAPLDGILHLYNHTVVRLSNWWKNTDFEHGKNVKPQFVEEFARVYPRTEDDVIGVARIVRNAATPVGSRVFDSLAKVTTVGLNRLGIEAQSGVSPLVPLRKLGYPVARNAAEAAALLGTNPQVGNCCLFPIAKRSKPDPTNTSNTIEEKIPRGFIFRVLVDPNASDDDEKYRDHEFTFVENTPKPNANDKKLETDYSFTCKNDTYEGLGALSELFNGICLNPQTT